MYKVTFLADFKNINIGFSTNISSDETIRINNTEFTMVSFNALKDLGIVKVEGLIESIIDTCNGCVYYGSPSAESAFSFNVSGDEADKVAKAVSEDIANAKFEYGSQYKFYDIENSTWKVSRLKKTASHLGRIAGGFAVPLDATNKKMFNRLEKLNTMYDLGLNRTYIRIITHYGV